MLLAPWPRAFPLSALHTPRRVWRAAFAAPAQKTRGRRFVNPAGPQLEKNSAKSHTASCPPPSPGSPRPQPCRAPPAPRARDLKPFGDLQRRSSGWQWGRGAGFPLAPFHWIISPPPPCSYLLRAAESCSVAAGRVPKRRFPTQTGLSARCQDPSDRTPRAAKCTKQLTESCSGPYNARQPAGGGGKSFYRGGRGKPAPPQDPAGPGGFSPAPGDGWDPQGWCGFPVLPVPAAVAFSSLVLFLKLCCSKKRWERSRRRARRPGSPLPLQFKGKSGGKTHTWPQRACRASPGSGAAR